MQLLDYVEQVVRLDERVAMRVADYRLPDGTTFSVRPADVAGLPGVTLDGPDGDPPAWLAVQRLPRVPPPPPPEALRPWLAEVADPAVLPAARAEILRTVSPAERAALIAADRAAEEDFAPVPAREGAEGHGDHDLRLRFADQPGLAGALDAYRAGPWAAWAADEGPRRRTQALYGALYRLQQALELGGGGGAVEAVWGIGPVRWRRGARAVDRPLIECAVELDLDPDGRLSVRPTGAPARLDLKPHEEMGADGLGALDAALRAGLAALEAEDGLSPFRPAGFAPLLRLAATRLSAGGAFHEADAAAADEGDGEPAVSGGWVLYARPRSQHVVLDDIARFRAAALGGVPVNGLAERLVTPPSDGAGGAWAPLGTAIGEGAPGGPAGADEPAFGEVFFPKPFNDDQVAIVRRLAGADGLVVQGPPGTGKTHTIANVICHAMALGQRVLVVSRGEAALSVLRDQLPEKVRPLTIAILSSERQGLRQVETAIREIQAVVEESRPEIRLSAIRRCEAEIVKIRARLAAIDAEVDGLAAREAVPLGPDGELPADLARRTAAERGARAWFDDAPALYAAEAGLTEPDLARLRDARAAAGDFLDHAEAALPRPDALPDPAALAAWHEDLLDGERLLAASAAGPAPPIHLAPEAAPAAGRAAAALRDLAAAAEGAAARPSLSAVLPGTLSRDGAPATAALLSCRDAWAEVEREAARLAAAAVELPPEILDDAEARAAVARARRGERLWPLVSLGHGTAKARVAAIRVRGRDPGRDAGDWAAVDDALALADARRALAARWRQLAGGAGGDGDLDGLAGAARLLGLADAMAGLFAALGPAGRRLPPPPRLARDPGAARALAAQIEAAAASARLVDVAADVAAAAARFPGSDRTSVMARQILDQLVGRSDLPADKIAALWRALLARLGEVADRAGAFALVRDTTARLASAGAPRWAARLRADPDPAALPADWRRAWDGAAAEAKLARADGREALLALARERDALDRRGRKLFVELVRERAFYALERRLSPRVKSALVEYVRALGRLGKGTGKGAGRHRRVARDAMARCYDAVPCWIMPTWRVAEQLPSDIAAFDLVVLDEASQSDVTELPALLRGRKILAVGDDRQVSPTPPFVSQAAVAQLRHRYLSRLPYAALLEPGESLYDLMRAVFPDSRLMLKEHFRCVEPIIRFSMGFYPETLIPLRVPAAAERLDPPLVDIHVPHGVRDGARKINRAEAEVIVDEVERLIASPEGAARSLGVISLVGAEQAELVRVLLTERIGEEAMQRHRVLCSNSAGFQGNERDVVFLSMVADRRRRTTLTALPYEQRFNVAASRARDRLVLVRSVGLDDLAAADLKHRLISHFERPMPAAAPAGDLAERCESGFERDVLARLLALGYRTLPQVGSEGFRIDLVVEGAEGRRLAVECDGDSFHGPERWRDDMRRQRILERVGWRFWRCFASSFYRDPDAVMADLVAALEREGIAPQAGEGARDASARLVEHRVAPVPAGLDRAGDARAAERIAVGDRVALLFPDRRRLTLRLTEGADDRAGGLLSVATPLGAAVARAEEGDEVEVAEAGAAPTRVLVEAVMRAA
ncbi:AAA domain-containing protein [Lichenibacterium dinghuense]|uniref:AAA domain-containing protein n=1 Tax=Lichenibacterium dinghuense TaxID=2895977 RepID=UPI001F27E107|nr:AAA domain-containing protein [Lichenibacterium sp. 6Y81]